MRPLYLILTILILAITSSSCRRNMTTEALTHASELIESHPDSAYAILHGIDLNSIRKSDIPLYALLEAQSCHKQDLPLPSDSLLTIAIAHYSAAGPDSLLMKSLYYRAVIRNTQQNPDSAITDISNSWDIACKNHYIYWQAKSAELIADIFQETVNINEETKWRKVASEKYKESGRIENHLFTLCDLISAQLNIGLYDEAIALADSLNPIIETHKTVPYLQHYYLTNIIPLYTYSGDAKTARKLLDSLKQIQPDLSPELVTYESRITLLEKNPDFALKILDQAFSQPLTKFDSILLLNEKSQIYAGMRNFSKAYNLADSVIKLQYDIFHAAMAHETSIKQRDIYLQKYTETQNRYNIQSQRVGIITITLIVLTSICVWIVITYRRKAKYQLENKIELIHQLQDQINKDHIIYEQLKQNADAEILSVNNKVESVKNEVLELNKKIELQMKTQEMLYKEKAELLNKICIEFHQMEETDADRKRVMRNISSYLKTLRDVKHINNIENAVNLYMNNVISRLRTQCPFLREDDIKFIILLYAGHSAKTVTFFTDMKLGYFYTKRDRLFNRILKSDAPDKLEFAHRIKDA